MTNIPELANQLITLDEPLRKQLNAALRGDVATRAVSPTEAVYREIEVHPAYSRDASNRLQRYASALYAWYSCCGGVSGPWGVELDETSGELVVVKHSHASLWGFTFPYSLNAVQWAREIAPLFGTSCGYKTLELIEVPDDDGAF